MGANSTVHAGGDVVDELAGRVAVVTGGGGGIGRALVLGAAAEGMDVVVADIDEAAAVAVADEVSAAGRRGLAVVTDVADRASVDSLADVAFDQLGAVHLLCNNAGVFVMGPILESRVEDWEWITSVNLMGIAHGIHAFVPRMLDQGPPGHIVNSASVAAIGGGSASGIYSMSKAAVLSISESLHAELAPRGVGVTALCPGNISSGILGAQRNRPERFGAPAEEPFGRDLVDFGTDPAHAARRALEAVRAGELYAFAHPEGWGATIAPRARQRFDAIVAAIEAGAVPDT